MQCDMSVGGGSSGGRGGGGEQSRGPGGGVQNRAVGRGLLMITAEIRLEKQV